MNNSVNQPQTATEALAVNEPDAEIYRLLIEHTTDIITIFSSDGMIRYESPSVERALGYTPQELVGCNAFELLHPDDRAMALKLVVKSMLIPDHVERVEFRFRHKDGGWRHFEGIGKNLLFDPRVRGMVIHSRDITERRAAEQKLRLLSTAVAAAANGIVITDRDGVIRWVNPAFTRLTGYSAEEAIGQTPRVLKSGAHDDRFYQQMWQQITSGQVWQDEVVNRRKDGSRYTEEMTITPLQDAAGQITHFIAIKQDVTQRKRAEDARRQSEERFAKLFHDNPIASGLTEPATGKFFDVNESFLRMTGYQREDVIGRTALDLGLWADAAARTALFRTLQERGVVSGQEVTMRNRKGERREIVAYFEVIEVGYQPCVMGMLYDETERRQVTAALRESEMLFRSLSASSPLGILMADAEGRWVYSNARCRDLFGGSLRQNLGDDWLQAVHPAEAERVRREWAAAVAAAGEHTSEFRLRGDRQGERWVHLRSSRMVTEDGQPRGRVATVEDITVRKQAEAELQESKRQLEEALQSLQSAQQQVIQQERLHALGTMASGIAHDFNNVLAAILGYSELLLNRPESLADQAKTRRYLQMINTAAQDAGAIVNRLREFYRHRDKAEAFAPVDLNQLVRDAVSLTQPKWQAQTEAHSVPVTVQVDTEPVPPVAGIAADLREVLANLIFNAVDAMPQGGTVTIRTRREKESAVLEVADTGTGMTAEVRRRCLEPFFTTKGDHGTGLGLAMVYGIIQRHGGTVDIQSQPGQGTAFRIQLRFCPAVPAAGSRAPVALLPPAQKFRVLVVDDDVQMRRVVTEYLQVAGHIVEAAENGRAGLEKFRSGQFDVVFMDRAMPGMSGDQAAAAIKSVQPALPIIMLTGFGSMMEAADEKPAEVDLVISKPVTMDTLHAALTQVTAAT